MRYLLSGIAAMILVSIQAQNIKSPDEFLGYKLGEKFTYHHKIVQYFNETAKAAPGKMKLEQYGTTNEGRELLLAYVSSSENIIRLEEIRKNNLRLAGILKDKAPDTDMPVIVWLSYNVHGNEASSSEVSMKTLYEFVSGKNSNINNWLKNTVVIIDPCLNPDGRDRYANWYNQVVGTKPVANRIAREHNEPWPGGRTNHYNFDLNRDWAWQTQVETKQRLKKYNEWMPEIHCDFHEQSYNSPYYFAPAAEPYHEVITPWQRELQVTIGKNHARYFDANNWLYFTKEIFDLFYPSYGDTYPMYNGSIGMTYEQAGLGKAGAAIATEDDTLTLFDRIAHHFTTSLSTVEVAAGNYQKINQEFKKYFDGVAANGSGTYKSYVISGDNKEKISSLIDLFKNNGINYGYAKNGTIIKGLNYFNKREQSYTTSSADIIVSTTQPKGPLVRVLFEPESKLSDSATYDITAWSLPYAYGTDCYAVKEQLAVQSTPSGSQKNNFNKNEFAYLIEYQSFRGGKILSELLKNNIKTRFAEKDFSFMGKKFKKGTLVVLRKGNEDKINQLIDLINIYEASVTAINSGFMESGFDFGSDKLQLIKKPVVAMLTGESVFAEQAGEVWHLFDKELDYQIVQLNADNLNNISLSGIDVIILPSGNYKNILDKADPLKTWVRQGGKLIAIENAAIQLANADWGIKLKTEDAQKSDESKENYTYLKRYENRERDWLTNNTPGSIYKVELDESNPLAFGYPSFYFTLKMNSSLIEFIKDGWNVGAIKKNAAVAGFVGSSARDAIKDGTVISSHAYGNGNVICFVDNPIFRCFWENGKLLLTNAVFLAR